MTDLIYIAAVAAVEACMCSRQSNRLVEARQRIFRFARPVASLLPRYIIAPMQRLPTPKS